MNRRALRASLVVLSALMPIAARAGIVLEFEHRFPTNRAPVSATAQIEPDRLRIDFGNRTIIYRDDRGLIWLVEPAEGRYTVLTRAQLKSMGEQMAALRTQLQERTKSMTIEQRAVAEQMIAAAGDTTPGVPPQMEKTGRTETINGFSCAGWEARRSGGTPQELWIADWKVARLQPADMMVLQRFGEFLGAMGPLAEKLTIGFAQKYDGPGALTGFPIRVVTPIGTGQLVDEVRSIRREKIPADHFELPKGMTAKPAGGSPDATPPAALKTPPAQVPPPPPAQPPSLSPPSPPPPATPPSPAPSSTGEKK